MISDLIFAEAQRQGVSPQLALEVAVTESSLNQGAIGAAGEIGVFQLMPATALALGVDRTDVNQNIQGGITLLRQMLAKYGDPGAALAAYNMGETKFDPVMAQWGPAWFAHIPSTTQSYINKILSAVQTQYTTTFSPAPLPGAAPSFSPSAGVLNIPPSQAAVADSGSSIWGTLGIAIAVILGLGYVLSES